MSLKKKASRRNFRLFLGLCLFVGVCVLLFEFSVDAHSGISLESSLGGFSRRNEDDRTVSDRKNYSSRDAQERIVDGEDESVLQCIALLKEIERKRISVSDPVKVDLGRKASGYEVDLEFRALTPDEMTQAKALLHSVKGLRSGKFSTVPWRRYLESQFALDWGGGEIKGLIFYNQNNNSVTCLISRINPESGKEEVRPVESYLLGGTQKNEWRFSHLIEFDEQ